MKFLTLIFILSTSSVFADAQESALLFKQESNKSLSPAVITSNPDVYLSNESMLRDSAGEEGIYSERYYTREDNLRLSIGYQISQDFEELSKLSIIDIQLHKKMDSYKDQWWGVQLKSISGEYNIFADELDDNTDPLSDGAIKRGLNTQTMTVIGLGLGYRFKTLSQMFNSDRVFENIMVFGNYVTNLDGATSKKYAGYGLTAEYSVQRRMSESMFINLKLGYNIASLVRAAESDEKQEDRSLVFRWTTLGFDFGYYF